MSDLTTALDELSTSTARTNTSTASKSASSDLGKDEFLKLLVTQMQYQDPLNPQTDADFIAQLAQFSSLEQMQNLNSNTMNSQALGLVGKEVLVSTATATGRETTIQGTVDFVTIKNGTAYVSIEETLYKAENVVTVMDAYYSIQKYLPSAEEEELSYDLANQKDLSFEINLGTGSYQASSVAVFVNGEAIDASNMSYKEGNLTISASALSGLKEGTYAVELYFDDVLKTSITDKITIKVTNSKSSETEDTGTTETDNAETVTDPETAETGTETTDTSDDSTDSGGE